MDRELRPTEIRILQHISASYRNGPSNRYEGPHTHTQLGIADAMGVVRSNVSKHLLGLVQDGYLECSRLRTNGAKRKRQCYFITQKSLSYLDGRA